MCACLSYPKCQEVAVIEKKVCLWKIVSLCVDLSLSLTILLPVRKTSKQAYLFENFLKQPKVLPDKIKFSYGIFSHIEKSTCITVSLTVSF